MRKRAVRDIGTMFGVVVILGGVVFFNGYMRRGTLATYYEDLRVKTEKQQSGQGVTLLEWNLLRKTKGSKRTGPKFDAGLAEIRDTTVNLIGFMVPLYSFRQVNEFLLLPLPVQCYFCEAPPMRDVMLVQMAEGETTDIVNEPVIVSGTLTLNEGPGTKFFYVLKNSSREAAEKGGKLTRKNIRPETIQHMQGQQEGEPQLAPGYELPQTPTSTTENSTAPAATP